MSWIGSDLTPKSTSSAPEKQILQTGASGSSCGAAVSLSAGSGAEVLSGSGASCSRSVLSKAGSGSRFSQSSIRAKRIGGKEAVARILNL